MKDFVSTLWRRAITLIESVFDVGTSTRTIWQVIHEIEAEPVLVPVTVTAVASSVPVTPRPPMWVR